MFQQNLLRDVIVGEVDTRCPALGNSQGGIDVQTVVGLTVGKEALVGTECEHHSAADGFSGIHVLVVGVVKVELHERYSGVRRSVV